MEPVNILDVHEKIIKSLNANVDESDVATADLDFYVVLSTPILNAYRAELSKPVSVNFMGSEIAVDSMEKRRLVDEYMRVAKPYIETVGYAIPTRSVDLAVCEMCDGRKVEPVDENTYMCADCGFVLEFTNSMFSYNDTLRVNPSTKYSYDRRVHFRDSINQFQGKQQTTIPERVYEELRERLEAHKLVQPGATKEERYAHVTKRHILEFLRQLGHTNHYVDLNLIYATITGAKLDDISHLEEVLLQDFETLNTLYTNTYVKTKRIARKSFINTQYVLFQLLRRHRYPCNEVDFNFLKTPERKCFHDEICSELFRKLGWNFTSVL